MKHSLLKLLFILTPLPIYLLNGFLFIYPPDQEAIINEPVISVPALNLYIEYEYDTDLTDEHYLGKRLEIRGAVTDKIELPDGEMMLVFQKPCDLYGVVCLFEASNTAPIQNIKIGDTITLRGRCAGKIVDVMLEDCTIKEPVIIP